MLVDIDKFRFKPWAKPEPLVCWLTATIHQSLSKKTPPLPWLFEEPGHLHYYIYLTLFGHLVDSKYRCLLEAYHRCDLHGTLDAQKYLAAELKKIEHKPGHKVPTKLVRFMLLCGVERAVAEANKKNVQYADLAKAITGELRIPVRQRDTLGYSSVKAAKRDINSNANYLEKIALQNSSLSGDCSSLSKKAAMLFPTTFKKVDQKCNDAYAELTNRSPHKKIRLQRDPHVIWHRIVQSSHPLEIFEVAWILIHFRLRDAHIEGL